MILDQRRTVLPCVLAASILILAACSGSGSTPTPADLPAEQPSPTAVVLPTERPAPPLPETSVAEVIFHNGTIITMDPDYPQAEAIAVVGDQVLAVGAAEPVLGLAVEGTVTIDLEGRTIVPGFIDSHAHWIGDRDMPGFGTPEEAIEAAIRRGWTSISELFVDASRLEELRTLDEAGQLRVRVNAYLPVNFTDDKFGSWYLEYEPGFEYSPYLRVAGIKLFMDHGWGSNIHWTQAELNGYVTEAHNAGWQVAAHTAGHMSHDMILDAYETALGSESNEGHRHRIEHVIQVRDDQLERMHRLGILASVQLAGPGDWPAEPDFWNMGAENLGWFMRWRDFAETGLHLVGSTDSPWVPIGLADPVTEEPLGDAAAAPLTLLYQAVTRDGYLHRKPEAWQLDQRLTAEQALQALTVEGAYATFQEEVKGSLASGRFADLVILSGDPLSVSPEELPALEVVMTMIGGRVEYCAPEQEALCPDEATADTESADRLVIAPDASLQIAILGPASGGLQPFTEAILVAVEMAAEDHGRVLGFPMQVVILDDGCEEAGGAEAAAQLAELENVVGVIGPLCSAAVRGSGLALEAAGIPAISPSATLPDLAAPSVFSRTVLNDAQIAAAGLEDQAYVNELAAVGVFYEDYRARTGLEPPADLGHFLAYAYDATMILLENLEAVADTDDYGSMIVESTALVAAVRETVAYPGLTGTITFDPQGNRVP